MSNSSFQCPNCGKKLDTGSELQSHIEIEHTQVSSLTLCSTVSSEYEKLLVEETDNFDSECEPYEEKEDLECSKCNFATYNPTDMDNHKKEKHVYQTYKRKAVDSITNENKKSKAENRPVCSICGESFSRKDSLKRHMSRKHD